jgi:hypothetical protein
MVTASTLQLLEWIDERPRTYAETMEAWHSHCPRLLVWEDALADGLVAVRNRSVVVTARGRGLTPQGSDPSSTTQRGLGAKAPLPYT